MRSAALNASDLVCSAVAPNAVSVISKRNAVDSPFIYL